MNKPYLLFICLTLIKCNGPQAKQEKQCVENLKFPELGKFFSQKIVYLLWITKKNIQKSRKKLTVWNFSDRKLSGRKLQNRKAFRKKVSFPKVYQTLKKKAFLWFKKEKVSCEKAYYTLYITMYWKVSLQKLMRSTILGT
jgi:hypothetical protein